MDVARARHDEWSRRRPQGYATAHSVREAGIMGSNQSSTGVKASGVQPIPRQAQQAQHFDLAKLTQEAAKKEQAQQQQAQI